MFLLIGCGVIENETTVEQQKCDVSVNDYKAKIQKLTDKEIYKMIIEDFDKDGKKEAFVLTKDNEEEGDENEFELWFFNSRGDEKILNRFIACNHTSIELLDVGNKYILFNKSQIRQNDNMQSVIYSVKNNKVVEVFKQKHLTLCIERNELYAYSGSYCVLEPQFKQWMALCEQKYHFKWDSVTETCKEYEARKISEQKFMEFINAKEVKEKIYNKLENKVSGKIKTVEYSYLLREDNTVDINMVVTAKDKIKYKYYVTVLYKDNVLRRNLQILEGNKEESIIKYWEKLEKQ